MCYLVTEGCHVSSDNCIHLYKNTSNLSWHSLFGIVLDTIYGFANILHQVLNLCCDAIQIFLDPKERNNTEYKLETYTAVYRRLCGKDVVFEYPMTENA